MLIYLICYAASFLLAHFGFYYPSGAALLLAAAYLYFHDYHKSGNAIHLRALFSAFWVGGQGIACLKLSKLQSDWSVKTWLCFLLAFLGFWVTYELLDRFLGEEDIFERGRDRRKRSARPLFYCIIGLTLVSVAAFLFEAISLGFVPLLLKGVPHAYSEFHITGVHYLTVSCVLVPALAVLYFLQGGSRKKVRNGIVILAAVISFAIPILCVSRFQLIFAVLTALFIFCAYRRKVGFWILIPALVIMIPAYVLLTVARSHDVAYLNSIFEMKYEQMPIFISQPYIYIANNYENFNCLVDALPNYTFGIRMLYPVWALTGLKFLYPYLISFPVYVDKAELTTVTLFYDAYYDFGIIGVLLFACILGAVAYCLVGKLKKMQNPIGYLLYGQFAVYMMLSFFTTWFSNPTTWFYFVVTAVMAVFCAISS